MCFAVTVQLTRAAAPPYARPRLGPCVPLPVSVCLSVWPISEAAAPPLKPYSVLTPHSPSELTSDHGKITACYIPLLAYTYFRGAPSAVVRPWT
eukprot:scaffold87553_cov65-Phaeocystis_antarctica.AAC.1